MPNGEVVRHTNEPTQIGTSDQLQQTKRSDRPVTDGPSDQQRGSYEALTKNAGILGQLEAERAHD